VEPASERVAGCHLLEPEVNSRRFLAHAARPEPLDQDAPAVTRCCWCLGPLECEAAVPLRHANPARAHPPRRRDRGSRAGRYSRSPKSSSQSASTGAVAVSGPPGGLEPGASATFPRASATRSGPASDRIPGVHHGPDPPGARCARVAPTSPLERIANDETASDQSAAGDDAKGRNYGVGAQQSCQSRKRQREHETERASRYSFEPGANAGQRQADPIIRQHGPWPQSKRVRGMSAAAASPVSPPGGARPCSPSIPHPYRTTSCHFPGLLSGPGAAERAISRYAMLSRLHRSGLM
jgi:hypothetical protein